MKRVEREPDGWWCVCCRGWIPQPGVGGTVVEACAGLCRWDGVPRHETRCLVHVVVSAAPVARGAGAGRG